MMRWPNKEGLDDYRNHHHPVRLVQHDEHDHDGDDDVHDGQGHEQDHHIAILKSAAELD